MWLIFSAPLGLAFGVVSWAFLRGRGGLGGLMLFALLGSIAALVGSLAAEALAGHQSDALTGFGAGVGAFLANLVIGLGWGAQPMAASADAD